LSHYGVEQITGFHAYRKMLQLLRLPEALNGELVRKLRKIKERKEKERELGL
jgi:hypothetical protein